MSDIVGSAQIVIEPAGLADFEREIKRGVSEALTKIEGQMPALITPEGVPTDSPVSAERRQRQKEELLDKIYDLQMRVKLLEQKETGK